MQPTTVTSPRMCCPECADGGREHVITDANGTPWRFEMSRFCGPIVLRRDGQPKEMQPGEQSPFWAAFDAWQSASKGGITP